MVFEHAAPEAPAAIAEAAGVQRISREGRVLTILSSAGGDAIVQAGRSLNARSIDVAPLSLKDIFLETVAAED
jgi:hypothetical protein